MQKPTISSIEDSYTLAFDDAQDPYVDYDLDISLEDMAAISWQLVAE